MISMWFYKIRMWFYVISMYKFTCQRPIKDPGADFRGKLQKWEAEKPSGANFNIDETLQILVR